MTTSAFKLKITAPSLKLKVMPRYPTQLQVASPITLTSNGGVYTFGIDLNALENTLAAIFEPLHAHVDQQITAGASAAVQANAETVRVNKAAGSPTTLMMPPANTMKFPVLIIDWKGDAAANNITIVPSGADTINGLASWTIAANNGSVQLKPIPGVGYAL
jgi:hypothetical protein